MKNSLEYTIRNHPFFSGMKANHLAILANGAKEVSYKPGGMMFKEGEPANQFFLIQRGEVVLEAHEPGDGTVMVETLREGDVIGWSWLFPPFTWHLQARTVEPTDMIVLDGARLLCAAEQHHDFGYELMKRVAQLAVHRLKATRKQLLELENKMALPR